MEKIFDTILVLLNQFETHQNQERLNESQVGKERLKSDSERLKMAQIGSKIIFVPNDQKCRDLARNVEKKFDPLLVLQSQFETH